MLWCETKKQKCFETKCAAKQSFRYCLGKGGRRREEGEGERRRSSFSMLSIACDRCIVLGSEGRMSCVMRSIDECWWSPRLHVSSCSLDLQCMVHDDDRARGTYLVQPQAGYVVVVCAFVPSSLPLRGFQFLVNTTPHFRMRLRLRPVKPKLECLCHSPSLPRTIYISSHV